MASASNAAAGSVKCCITPGRSLKRTSTNFTPSSEMNFRTSSGFLNTLVDSSAAVGAWLYAAAWCGLPSWRN